MCWKSALLIPHKGCGFAGAYPEYVASPFNTLPLMPTRFWHAKAWTGSPSCALRDLNDIGNIVESCVQQSNDDAAVPIQLKASKFRLSGWVKLNLVVISSYRQVRLDTALPQCKLLHYGIRTVHRPTSVQLGMNTTLIIGAVGLCPGAHSC